MSALPEDILIESKWNLKRFSIRFLQDLFVILIESKWNLKLDSLTKEFPKASILIESKWNLKCAALFSMLHAFLY